MKNLAIIITHPIQYYAPVFQLLAKCCTIKLFYTFGEKVLKDKYDPGFGKIITWETSLLISTHESYLSVYLEYKNNENINLCSSVQPY